MNMNTAIDIAQTDKEITFSLVLDAPQDLVFKTFTEAEHVKQWWGPKNCPVTHCTIDFRVGGEWLYSIQTPEGSEHWAKAIYDEIEPNKRIVFTDYFIKEDGSVIESLPSKQISIKFDEIDGKTHVDIHVVLASVAERQKLVDMGFLPGFTDALNNLSDLVSKLRKS